LRNVGGFLVKDVQLEEVAKYIAELPSYKRIKRQIDTLRKRIKNISSEKVKWYLRNKLKQLIEEKKKIMAVAFYEKYGSKATLARATYRKAKTFGKSIIGDRGKQKQSRYI